MELFEPVAAEPLGVWAAERRGDAPEGVREWRFEFSSRGDRVPGRLLVPSDAAGPHPLVVLQHGAGGSKQAPYVDATALPWVRSGAAVASIDLPLHGERESGKLTVRFLEGLAFGGAAPMPPFAAFLWGELVRQSVIDLRRALDALATLSFLDPERIAFAAFSLGSILGACFCGVDPRPRAAALALGGGGFGPPELDPARWIARFAPRPCLFVAASKDERIPRRATQTLYEAASAPKQLLWFDCDHQALPGAALKAMWSFLREPLGLSPAP